MGHPLNVSDISSPIPGKVKKFTKRHFKLKTRTRLLLVFFGSLAIITGWFSPWYAVNYFLTVDAWRVAADGSHYVAVGQLSGADDLEQKYGENIAQNEYSGGDLVREGFIKVDQNTLYWWLGLVAITLLAIKLDDLRISGKVMEKLKEVLDGVKILTHLTQVGWVLWYCVQTTSIAWIDNVARTEMIRFLGTSKGILFIQPGLSIGLLCLALGLILNSLGVFSGDKAASINANTISTRFSQLRLTAGVCAVIGILFFIITVVTSTGKFPH